MKPHLFIAIAILICIVPVSATSLNFQDTQDLGYITTTCSLRNSSVGGNNYMYCGNFQYLQNANPTQFTYAAVTSIGSTGLWSPFFELKDGTGASIAAFGPWGDDCAGIPLGSNVRWEVNVVGGTAYYYGNGRVCSNSTPLTVNPSYLEVSDNYGDGHSGSFDDFVIGETENKYVFGNPESNLYIIRKDLISPATSGFAHANGTIINSNNMTSTYSRGNITYLGNESVQLVNSDTGTIYGTRYTGYTATGQISWALQDELITSGAPNGYYHVTIPSSGATSEQIQYTATGATLALDRTNYSIGDTATASGEVQLGGYWDTSTYSYKVAFRDAYGNYIYNSSALTSRVFSESYTFDDTDTQGAYYAILMATPLAGGPDYWLALDYCQLTAYLNFNGYVNDENGNVISGAAVNITQDALVVNYTTGADGAYQADNYITGSQIVFNVTATGHQQYYKTTTPLAATSTTLNFTLPSDSLTYYGLAIGGVAREGIITGIDISDGLGKPIEGATVVLKNTTNGNYHTNLTNVAGWYLADEGSSIVLISKRPYDVWGMKTGYSNSANYTVVAP